jgi:hypothetical protein
MKQLKEMDLDSPTRKNLVGLCQAMHVQVGGRSIYTTSLNLALMHEGAVYDTSLVHHMVCT